jgi:hypothetical protein
MKQEANLIRARLKTPRAAAIAVSFFSVLLITGLVLFRLSVRADPLEAGTWLKTSSNRVAPALNLVPFAGIAFLWFIGVLRDRLGNLKTASLLPSFSEVGFCSSPCCSLWPPRRAADRISSVAKQLF